MNPLSHWYFGIVCGLTFVGCSHAPHKSQQSDLLRNYASRTALDQAREGFLQGVPDAWAHEYGFTSKAQMDSSQYGTPIPIWTWDTQSALPTQSSKYEIPWTIAGSAMAWQSLDSNSSGWQSAQLGSALLARRWESLLNELGPQIKLFRSFVLNADYAWEPNSNQFHPVQPGQKVQSWEELRQLIRTRLEQP